MPGKLFISAQMKLILIAAGRLNQDFSVSGHPR